MSSDSVKITKVVHTTTNGTGNGEWSDEWKKALGGYGQQSSGNTIWIPQDPQQNLFPSAVTGRCYNRSCKNETRTVTQISLGLHLNLKTYICEECLIDLASKVKSELGIEEEEPKDV